MTYNELHQAVESVFDQQQNEISLDHLSIRIRNYSFVSRNCEVLPEDDTKQNHTNGKTVIDQYTPERESQTGSTLDQLIHSDQKITTNRTFRYSLFLPSDTETPRHLIILFHGLNEKYWNKYLSWAARLVRQTGQGVLLFPIAFHMNRAPATWSDPRYMKQISDQRKEQYPAISKSTFANAAISTRLQHAPQRLFWSGLQSYRDVIQLVQQIRNREHPAIHHQTHIDLFGYSIGSLLSQILIMSNPNGQFGDSRLFIFCGGPTLDRMEPVSKYIMDSEANIALYAYFFQHLEKELKKDSRLSHYFEQDRQAATYFRSLLNYYHLRSFREQRFHELRNHIVGVGLQKDHVVPAFEIVNTLKGVKRNISIPVHLLDFPFIYSHVNPFPLRENIEKNVNEGFEQVFKLASDHLAI